jgi:dTDP-4-dehydrorhamnose reductase
MKILLIGANGQLGTDLMKVLTRHEVVPATVETLDVVKMDQVCETFERERPQVIISTAAFHAVDLCETEIMQAFAVNAYGVRNLALAAKEIDAALVHFSTDYVFDGHSSAPYKETDVPHPISAYGISKLAGEKFLGYLWEKCFIIRTCGLYGHAGLCGKGMNFVEVMLKKGSSGEPFRVVHDQRVTPTSTRELARKVAELIETEFYGLYHITSNGDCTWFEFAREIFALQGMNVQLLPTTQQEFRAAARRPAYSVLENFRLKQLGKDDLKDWREALAEYLAARA